MRALLAGLMLLLAPASAFGKPLDDDRSFARSGIFRLDDPDAAYAVVPHPDGGSLYAAYDGLLRLSPGGRRLAAPPLVPTGIPHTLIPGLAVGVQTPLGDYGKPAPLSVWRLAADGTTLAHHQLAVPGRSVTVDQAVRRGDGYALLLRVSKPTSYRSTRKVAVLTADGDLDQAWGKGGFRSVAAESVSIGAGADGSVVIATDRTIRCVNRPVRPVLRVTRIAPGGRARTRRHVLGPRRGCTSARPGEIHVDRRGRITIAGGFRNGGALLRLQRDLRRDRRFGIVRVTRKPVWWHDMQLAPRRGGGFGVGFTTTNDLDVPHAHAALVSGSGRVIRARRLRVARAHPSSEARDVAFDRAGRLLVAGVLRDDNVFIREDYGQPHLAVWRLRTTG